MSLLNRRMMMAIAGMEEEEEMAKEWTLLHTIEISEDNEFRSIEFTDLDVTEIFIQANQLVNKTESTQSAVRVYINDQILHNELDTVGTTKTVCYQHAYFKYNDLFWEIRKSAQTTLKDNYQYATGNAQYPYNVNMDIGKCNKLKIMANTTYELIGGTIEVYVR